MRPTLLLSGQLVDHYKYNVWNCGNNLLDHSFFDVTTFIHLNILLIDLCLSLPINNIEHIL